MSRFLNLKVPKGWRKGQTIFNFLWWLKTEKLFTPELLEFDDKGNPVYASGRMADPFHISDAQLESLFEEFLTVHDK
jgi:hypothetical protein